MSAGELSLVVTNVKLRTGDTSRPWATALGIRDGKLAVVGSAAEILKMTRADARIVDASGQLLTLPAGLATGSAVTVTVAPDGAVTVRAPGETS